MPGGVSCFWKVKRTLGVAEEGGPSASAIFFFLEISSKWRCEKRYELNSHDPLSCLKGRILE